jgi:leucyl aminopeptidase
MKCDMSGAAAVLGIMSKIAEIKPNVEVHAIIAATENMPGCGAYKPGDILKAMNGKTIEVDNTDAEGRLTLADAISYAAKLDVEEIIDIATLTGACSVALGEEAAGIMGNNQELINSLIASAEKSAERFWQLPLYPEHKTAIKSPVADIKNTGGTSGGGAMTAAAFLREFVSDKKWAHIDIAGPAFLDKEVRGVAKGASGITVASVIDYLVSQ